MQNLQTLEERKIIARLRGVPLFTIDRPVVQRNHGFPSHISCAYIAKFPNGYGASIIQFHDKIYSGDCDWELAILRFTDSTQEIGDLDYETGITKDVERGNDVYMDELLSAIEELCQPE